MVLGDGVAVDAARVHVGAVADHGLEQRVRHGGVEADHGVAELIEAGGGEVVLPAVGLPLAVERLLAADAAVPRRKDPGGEDARRAQVGALVLQYCLGLGGENEAA